jgi:hypothetical protein
MYRLLQTVIIGSFVLTACAVEPSPSLPAYAQFQRDADALSEGLKTLEWDFHTAVQRRDDEAARRVAADAVSLIEAFQEGPLRRATEACLDRARLAVEEFLDLDLARWRRWSLGEDYPDRDEISLFFAFAGSERPWNIVLEQAGALCRQRI